MDNQIDLGSKPEPMPMPAEVGAKSGKAKAPTVSYPTLYASKHVGKGETGFEGMPEPGKEFDFHGHGKVLSHSHEQREGKAHHRVELEVHHIVPHSSKGEKTGGEGEPSDPGEGLQQELKKIEKKKSKPKGKENETEE